MTYDLSILAVDFTGKPLTRKQINGDQADDTPVSVGLLLGTVVSAAVEEMAAQEQFIANAMTRPDSTPEQRAAAEEMKKHLFDRKVRQGELAIRLAMGSDTTELTVHEVVTILDLVRPRLMPASLYQINTILG